MKKLKLLGVALALGLATANLAACSSNEETNNTVAADGTHQSPSQYEQNNSNTANSD